jgi:hypothetical protein
MRLVLLTLALLLPAIGLAGDSDVKQRLASGEVIVKSKGEGSSGAPSLKAMGVINASPDKIWPIIDKCDDYEKTMQRVAAAEELSRVGDTIRCRVTIEMPFPLSNLTAVTEAVHTVKPGKMYKREWKLVEGDYKTNRGSWTLVPFDDAGTKTLAVYEVHAEPNVPIPDGIKRAAQKKSIPELFEHLRSQVE